MRRYFLRITALIITLISLILIIFYIVNHPAHHDLISLFPMQQYDQNISNWIKPSDIDYDKPLLTNTQQKMRYDEWYDHNYGAHSPWSPDYVRQIYSEDSLRNIKLDEEEKINFYSNKNKLAQQIGYGSNFLPYPVEWMDNLQAKMNLNQFDICHYSSSKRAIAVENISARELPTNEVHFYNPKIAGQGYPFDNLQASVIWAGTPLYILGQTSDHDWSLVLAPSFIAWVKNTEIASVDDDFIKIWTEQAGKNLVAITQTNIPIKDAEDDYIYRFSAYIGMAFPGSMEENKFHILIPISDEKHQAHIHHSYLAKQQATFIPLLPTPHNFVKILSQLIGRPYGWGNMYFYNDCASELKNLYSPFGIWLPTHSSEQVNQEEYLIKTVDLSNSTLDKRLDYLTKHGHKFMTIVYIGGHVFMYVGSYPNPTSSRHELIALSYQNMWALKPNNGNNSNNYYEDRRAVIGKAVLFPILKKYPEDATLASPASHKYFKMAYLDISAKD